MKLSLPKSVASPQDLSALIVEIKSYASWYNHEAIKKRLSNKPLTNHQNAPVLSAGASEILRSWFGTKQPNRLGFDALIKELSRASQASQLITVTLAAPAPASLKATLVDWFRKNVSPSALVAFHINSTILGGMVVQYGSHVFDWSFRRHIIANKHTFPEVLKRV